jgi:hypothetical protein
MTGSISPRYFPSVVSSVTHTPQIPYERPWMGLLKSIFNRHTAAVSRELVAHRIQELTQVESKVNQVLGMDARYVELLRNCVTENLKFFNGSSIFYFRKISQAAVYQQIAFFVLKM